MTKVLLVEDNPMNMELVLEILESIGFSAYGARDGKEAVEMAEKETYDLILMDIELPDMDGVEVTRIIRKRNKNKNTPIIALTAFAMKGDRENFLASGFSDYVPKPVDVGDFMKKIEKYKRI